MHAETGDGRVALDGHDLVEHLQRVVVDVEVVEHVLLHPAQGEQLGQHEPHDPVRLHLLEAGAHRGGADDLLELAEDALGRDAVEPRRLPADRRRRVRLDRQPEEHGEADRPQRAERVGGERAGAHHPQPARREVGAAAVRVEHLAAGERLGHRVDREVARGEVRGDVVVAQRHEVHVPGAFRADHAPGAERARELEGRAARLLRHRSRGGARVARHGEVEVDGLAPEQPVAHGPADDPGVRAGEDVARGVDRRLHRWCSRGTRPLIAHVTS